VPVLGGDKPARALAARRDAFGPRHDPGAAARRVARVEDDEPGIVDAAIGIGEAAAEDPLHPGAPLAGKIDTLGGGQRGAAAEMVVEEETEADHPGRAPRRLIRHDEAERAHQMRRDAQKDLALGERFAHEAELVMLEITQPAMDELGGGRGRAAGEIVALGERDGEAAAGGVARDPGAVDAAADDEKIDLVAPQCFERGCGRRSARQLGQRTPW
jgi:hypothetical protein